MKKWQTWAIWGTGLLASGLIGALIGEAIAGGGGLPGVIAGPSLFICIRLWVTENNPTIPVYDLKDGKLER